MNVLTYSSLYPNNVDASHGIFVERRLLEYVRATGAGASVVSPVPWFPFRSRVFGRYAEFAAVEREACRDGIRVRYPRYPLVPKIGMLLTPKAMAQATAGTVANVIREDGPVGIIDAHYFYPDGVAAAQLADRFGLPFVVTARGSDINLIAQLPAPRRMILEAARSAAAIVAVSAALGEELVKLGVDRSKIHVLRNGVDLTYFEPGDRAAARQKLGFDGPTVLSVGALKEAKGHDVAIQALADVADTRLIIIGCGADKARLRDVARSAQVDARVHFAGRLDADALRLHYQAADALWLVSRREGMPNVVLESLACGTPVIAADVGGIGEVIASPVAGRLLPDREPATVAAAWRDLHQAGIDRDAVRAAAAGFAWAPTISRMHELFVEHARPAAA